MASSISKILDKEKTILSIIRGKRNVDFLLNSGYSYSQISLIINKLINKKLVAYENDKLTLTKEGNDILKRDKPFFIPEYKMYKITKIKNDTPYIPCKSTAKMIKKEEEVLVSALNCSHGESPC